MMSFRTRRGGNISKTAYNRFNWSTIQVIIFSLISTIRSVLPFSFPSLIHCLLVLGLCWPFFNSLSTVCKNLPFCFNLQFHYLAISLLLFASLQLNFSLLQFIAFQFVYNIFLLYASSFSLLLSVADSFRQVHD